MQKRIACFMKKFRIGVAIYMFCFSFSIIERVLFWKYYLKEDNTVSWIDLYNVTMFISIVIEFSIIIYCYVMIRRNLKLNDIN